MTERIENFKLNADAPAWSPAGLGGWGQPAPAFNASGGKKIVPVVGSLIDKAKTDKFKVDAKTKLDKDKTKKKKKETSPELPATMGPLASIAPAMQVTFPNLPNQNLQQQQLQQHQQQFLAQHMQQQQQQQLVLMQLQRQQQLQHQLQQHAAHQQQQQHQQMQQQQQQQAAQQAAQQAIQQQQQQLMQLQKLFAQQNSGMVTPGLAVGVPNQQLLQMQMVQQQQTQAQAALQQMLQQQQLQNGASTPDTQQLHQQQQQQLGMLQAQMQQQQLMQQYQRQQMQQMQQQQPQQQQQQQLNPSLQLQQLLGQHAQGQMAAGLTAPQVVQPVVQPNMALTTEKLHEVTLEKPEKKKKSKKERPERQDRQLSDTKAATATTATAAAATVTAAAIMDEEASSKQLQEFLNNFNTKMSQPKPPQQLQQLQQQLLQQAQQAQPPQPQQQAPLQAPQLAALQQPKQAPPPPQQQQQQQQSTPKQPVSPPAAAGTHASKSPAQAALPPAGSNHGSARSDDGAPIIVPDSSNGGFGLDLHLSLSGDLRPEKTNSNSGSFNGETASKPYTAKRSSDGGSGGLMEAIRERAFAVGKELRHVSFGQRQPPPKSPFRVSGAAQFIVAYEPLVKKDKPAVHFHELSHDELVDFHHDLDVILRLLEQPISLHIAYGSWVRHNTAMYIDCEDYLHEVTRLDPSATPNNRKPRTRRMDRDEDVTEAVLQGLSFNGKSFASGCADPATDMETFYKNIRDLDISVADYEVQIRNPLDSDFTILIHFAQQ
ncbi:hypothetical protein DIPPA_22220 [Diplonema papillatum]|nr:hypothetical protein DIPPA_22220 [Diplonema papillatum]